MTDYSAFAPARPPQSPTDPSAPSPTSSHFALAPQFNNLQIDQSYPRQNQQNQYQQQYSNYQREQPSFQQGVPPQLNIPSSNFNSGPRSPASPLGGGGGGYGYSSANRPRPNLAGGAGGVGGGPPISPTPGDSPTRVPRKSSLAQNNGMSPSPSHERLPPLPTSSSSMHFPKTFGTGDNHNQNSNNEVDHNRQDSNGGEAVFNGAALASANSQTFASPPPSSPREPQSAPPKAPPPAKKANPLEDLIATETLYVEDLGAVIKRVAAAWSRSNFPPPALDTMFRAVEAVYRINKTLLGKLNDIGPNPSSPKALGDLLMRWITDIEPAYSRYGSTLLLDFDSYAPVQSNPKLAPILSSLPWPGTLPSFDQYGLSSPRVSLDVLFELPVHRIRYYKKLYAKLLRSTQEGRSDHALLVTANDKLAKLEKLAEEGKKRSVLGTGEERIAEGEQTVAREGQASSSHGTRKMPPKLDLKILQEERNSGESGRIDSPSSSSIRSSSATGTSTANTSTAHSSGNREPPLRVDELERRLATDRTLDIFSMQPRKCKLQMQPPSLTFQRQLRRACSAVVSFTPASDPSHQLVIHPRAYIILLTDLFLLCEWALPNETSSPNQDLTLLYPPLAGKHLRVSETGNPSELEVSIMGKEKLTIKFGGGDFEARDWKMAMEEAAKFGANYTMSLRADSTASAQPRSPLSPISTAPPQIPRVLSPTNETLSPVQGQMPSFPVPSTSRSLSRSPEPVSPNSNYSRQDSFNSMGAFPHSNDPRGGGGYGQVPSISRPDRSASIARNESPNSFLPSPSSTNFAGDNSSNGGSRGASPLRTDFTANGLPQPPFSPERQPPFQIHPQPGDFGGPGFNVQGGGGNYSSRPSSRTSQNSFGSSSNRTDRSSGYPEPPPPLPKERSYNGLNISGRGGPLYPTSMRTDPGDSRSVSGHSDYLSPHNSVHRSKSAEALRVEPPQHYRMPSQALSEERSTSNPAFAPSLGDRIGGEDDSPPPSPVGARATEKTAIVADMRCKIFLQQHHSVWKSLGTAKLKLYQSMPSNTKQLVVDSDKSKGKTLISTIVLTDGVERVGKTGVAIELSDQGDRTGIIYMLQMKTETSATGLFEQLLAGSDRAKR